MPEGIEPTEAYFETIGGNYCVFESAETNPAGTDYVRFVDLDGNEIAYWVSDEWCDGIEQAREVMGAIMGACLCAEGKVE